MTAKENFRKNLKKLIRKKKLTNGSFGSLAGMSTERIQRYSNCQNTGRIDLDDADKIARALGTTLGNMTGAGNDNPDYLVRANQMYEDAIENLKQVRGMVLYLSDLEAGLKKDIKRFKATPPTEK